MHIRGFGYCGMPQYAFAACLFRTFVLNTAGLPRYVLASLRAYARLGAAMFSADLPAALRAYAALFFDILRIGFDGFGFGNLNSELCGRETVKCRKPG